MRTLRAVMLAQSIVLAVYGIPYLVMPASTQALTGQAPVPETYFLRVVGIAFIMLAWLEYQVAGDLARYRGLTLAYAILPTFFFVTIAFQLATTGFYGGALVLVAEHGDHGGVCDRDVRGPAWPGGGGALDVGEREGLLRTAAHGFLDPGPQRIGRPLGAQVQPVVVAHLEHLGHQPHAHRVALAESVVDDHSHPAPPLTRV
jgi:hypothetical protein